MALFIFLNLIFVVISVQGGQDDDNQWQGFQPIRMPNFYFPPPQFPPYFSFPPYPEIPSAGEIKNMKGGPGQVYAGVAVSSASGDVRDKDGKKVKRKGGVTIVTNNNGKVKEINVGESPPKIDEPIV